MQAKIITAHSYSPKDKLFCVGAYVLETHHAGLPISHTARVLFNYALDEDKETARSEAVARILKDNERHPADMAVEVGPRVSLERIQGMAF